MCVLRFAVASLFVASSALLLPQRGVADETAASLVGRLPSGTNAIGVVHIADMLNSPIARAEGWDEAIRRDFIAGATVVPKWADVVVIGAPVLPGAPEPLWSASLFTGPETLGVAQLAPGGTGELSQLAGKPAFVSRSGAYVAEIRPGLLAAYDPPNRQVASRWLRSLENESGEPASAFLAAAAASKADLVLAVDLRDMFDPVANRDFARTVPGIPEAQAIAVADLITGAIGLTVEIEVAAEITATMRITFGEPIELPAELVGTGVKVGLAALGLSVEELENATFAADGADLSATFLLSRESFGAVVSLLAPNHRHPDGSVGGMPIAEGRPAATADPASPETEPVAGKPSDERSARYAEAVLDAVRRMDRLYTKGTS
ncbi:MAG: hypothetical protein AAF907_14840, partial [Planctomycetota bacterium]